MANSTEQENKRQDKTHPTNEFDVEIAKVEEEVRKYSLELKKSWEEFESRERAKTKRLELIVSSVERLAISGMILGGFVHSTNRRYDSVDRMAELDE